MSEILAQPRYTCALGAQQTVLAIPRGIPIVHAGPGCSTKQNGFAAFGNGLQGEGYAGGNHVSCTNTGEPEVVFGGEELLRNVVDGALKVIDGDLYVIFSGCTAGIVGDDVVSVAKNFAREGHPVVGVDAPGFKGTNYEGHEFTILEVLKQYVGKVEPQVKKGLVNVFADVPFQNTFWRGDLETIKALLEGIGLKVNILFGIGSQGVSEWKDIPNAQFNLLLSPWVGHDVVTYLEETYHTPFLHIPYLPIGAYLTGQFLRETGKFAGIEETVVENFIASQETRYYDYFNSIVEFLADFQNNLPYELFLTADSLYALSVTKFLEQELGFLPRGVYITEDPQGKNEELVKEAYAKLLPEYKDVLYLNADINSFHQKITDHVKECNRTLLLGSDWERDLARKTGTLFSYLGAPIHQHLYINKTYVGYNGALTLIEDAYNSLFAGGTVNSATNRD
jgi:nitrogenase molybdenum-iron protein beta chain